MNIRCPHCGKIAATVQPVIPTFGMASIENLTLQNLRMRIADYPWPVKQPGHIIHNLINSGFHTFDDICRVDKYALIRIPNFGRRSLTEVEAAMANLGLRFGMSVDPVAALDEQVAQ